MANFKLCKMCEKRHGELCEGGVTCGDFVELEQRTAALLEAALNAGNCITDMFEQMERGNWVDDHSHDVRLNVHMQRLIPAVKELMQAIAQAEGK